MHIKTLSPLFHKRHLLPESEFVCVQMLYVVSFHKTKVRFFFLLVQKKKKMHLDYKLFMYVYNIFVWTVIKIKWLPLI